MDDQIFKLFKTQSKEQLLTLTPKDIVPYNVESEIPRCLSLVFQPTQKDLLDKIHKLQKMQQMIEPDNYYYSDAEFHSTIIGNFPASINNEKLIEAIQKHINIKQLKFHISGVGSNKYCTSISCYPIDFSIHELREKVRKEIGDYGDDLKVHLETYEYMGWINYMRYKVRPSEELLNILRSHTDTDFGTWTEGKLCLYETTSKTLNPNKRRLIWETK